MGILPQLIFATQLLKRRLPARKVAGGLLNLTAFKFAAYSFYCASGFFTFLGIYSGLLNFYSCLRSILNEE